MNAKVSAPARHIVVVEATGIAVLVMLAWALELIDVTNIIQGHPETPINYGECILESALLLIVGIVIISITRRLLSRLDYLESLLHICSFCKKIRVGDKWIPLEQYIIENTEAQFSHGFCPECGEKHYGEYLNWQK